MQAIETKYLCPTNHRGARIKATCAAKSITVTYDHGCDDSANHLHAAETLALDLGWSGDSYGTLRSGCLASGHYCHVLVPVLATRKIKS